MVYKMITLDSMQPEDVERLFGHHRETTLRQINEELGNKVLDVWVDTGIQQAHKEHILPYEIPEYLGMYIKKRYENYEEAQNDKSKRSRI